MNRTFSVLGHWPIPMAALICASMIVTAAEETVTLPDWLIDGLKKAPELPQDPPVPVPQPKALPAPYAPVPGRDDRTPIPYLSLVFDLNDPALPEKLTGIGPVFWKHSGQGTGAVIAPDVILTTGHLFAKQGKWKGPVGLSPKPPAASDGRIFLEACGESYTISQIHLGAMAPRAQLGLDYAIAKLERPVCEAARVLPVAATPDDLSAPQSDILLSLGAYRYADIPRYAQHSLLADRTVGDTRYSVFGVRCLATGREDTGTSPDGSAAVIVTQGCDAVPGGSGGPLLLSRDGGQTYNIIGVSNSYRKDSEYNNYTRIEGAFAAHLAQFVAVSDILDSSAGIAQTAPIVAPQAPWLPMAELGPEVSR